MDLVGLYMLCVSTFILFMGLITYMWLKIVEYQYSALRLRTVSQNFGYPMEVPAGPVERYIVTVAAPADDIRQGNGE